QATQLTSNDHWNDKKRPQRQKRQQTKEHGVPKACEKRLEPNLGPASSNDPERSCITFPPPHEGVGLLGLADIGNVGGVDTGKIVQQLFNILGNVSHLHRVATDVSGVEP